MIVTTEWRKEKNIGTDGEKQIPDKVMQLNMILAFFVLVVWN